MNGLCMAKNKEIIPVRKMDVQKCLCISFCINRLFIINLSTTISYEGYKDLMLYKKGIRITVIALVIDVQYLFQKP